MKVWLLGRNMRYEIPRNSPDNGQSSGFAKFYATVDLRQVNREIADSDHFYHGRLGVNESGGCILRIGLNDGLMVLFCDFYRYANETKC